MRVLFVSNYYPPHEVGGYEQLCRDVAARLGARRHVCEILTSVRGIGQGPPLLEPGVHRLLRIGPQPGARLGAAAQSFLTRRRTESYNRRTLRKVVEEFGPDVVFIWNLQGLPHELALDAEAWSGVSVAYWLAGYTPAEPDSFWRYWMRAPGRRASLEGVKSALRPAAIAQMRSEGKPVRPEMRHVAVVSDYMRSKGLAEGTLPEHTRVIYNGVEVEAFYRPVPLVLEGPLRMLVAGRVSPDKGVHTAVEAVGYLQNELGIRSVHLTIAGSGPRGYLEGLKQSVRDDGLDDQVSFIGHIPREDVPRLMADCHALLLPSTYPEAFSRAVLEGMACGLAVVGTLVGGTGELLRHDVTGLAFVAGDSSDLAHQIGRLVVEPGLRQRAAQRGQSLVLEHFSLERMVDHVEALLQEAIAGQS